MKPNPRARPLHPLVGIGHVHLKVAYLDRALAFYRDVLGFEVTQRYGTQAAFLSAGGYHHHSHNFRCSLPLKNVTRRRLSVGQNLANDSGSLKSESRSVCNLALSAFFLGRKKGDSARGDAFACYKRTLANNDIEILPS